MFEIRPPDTFDFDAFPRFGTRIRFGFISAAAIAWNGGHIPAAFDETDGEIGKVSGRDDVVRVKIVIEDGGVGTCHARA